MKIIKSASAETNALKTQISTVAKPILISTDKLTLIDNIK